MKRFSFIFATILLAGMLLFFAFDAGYFAAKPAVDTVTVEIQGTSATLNGHIEEGDKLSQYGFRWGSSKKLGQDVKLGNVLKANAEFSTFIKGLKAGCTYYYQAYAINKKGSGYGEIKSFKIPEPKNEAPQVSISDPEDHSAVVIGTVVKVSATAKDDHKVKTMSLSINGVSKTEAKGASLSYDWSTDGMKPGEYALKISAWDGSKTGEKSLQITLKEKEAEAANQTRQSSAQENNNNYNNSSNNNNSNNGEPSRGGGSTDLSKYPKVSKMNGIFGQFHYRELSGGRIEVDPQWVAENIVTITLPGLNQKVQVHKLAADNFIMAFNYIKNGTAVINGRQVSLLSLIYTMDGTYVARHVNWNPSRGLSNHSWGTAMDINADDHFCYVDSANDPNMILWEKAFKPAGFSWGNRYSDSMHYELIK